MEIYVSIKKFFREIIRKINEAYCLYFYKKNSIVKDLLNIDEAIPYIHYKVKYNTYDGSGQAVHPSILIKQNEPFYIMAFTPYPFGNDKYENPSLSVSNDGIHFIEETLGINPLDYSTQPSHNCDVNIFYDGKYKMLYLEAIKTTREEYQNLFLIESIDRIKWSMPKRIYYDDLIKCRNEYMLSPCFVKDKINNTVKLFYVNRDYDKINSIHKVEYVEGDDINHLDFHKRLLIDLHLRDHDINPWHIDVITTEDFFYMLISAINKKDGKNQYALYIARSIDLISWQISLKKNFAPYCYKTTGFVSDGRLMMYYSHKYCINKLISRKHSEVPFWKIEFTCVPLADLF